MHCSVLEYQNDIYREKFAKITLNSNENLLNTLNFPDLLNKNWRKKSLWRVRYPQRTFYYSVTTANRLGERLYDIFLLAGEFAHYEIFSLKIFFRWKNDSVCLHFHVGTEALLRFKSKLVVSTWTWQKKKRKSFSFFSVHNWLLFFWKKFLGSFPWNNVKQLFFVENF